MECIRHVIQMQSIDDQFNLIPVSDLHWRSAAMDKAKLDSVRQRIIDEPNTFTLIVGDIFENNSVQGRNGINPHYDEQRTARDGESALIDNAIPDFVKYWKPVAKKTIGALRGNHEDRNVSSAGFRTRICDPLKIKYLGDACYIQLIFILNGKIINEYTILAEHSRISAGTHGGVLNAAANKMKGWDCDVYLFGHTHFAFVDKMYRNSLDTIAESPQIATRKILIANTGSFQRSHVAGEDLYGDKNLSGTIRGVGTVTITFQPRTGDMFGHD